MSAWDMLNQGDDACAHCDDGKYLDYGLYDRSRGYKVVCYFRGQTLTCEQVVHDHGHGRDRGRGHDVRVQMQRSRQG